MFTNILGAYQSQHSIVHSLDARIKIAFILVFSISIFFLQSFIGLAIFLCISVLSLVAARIPIKQSLVSLRPLSFILLFMFFANALGMNADIPLINTFGFSYEGIWNGAFYALRIMMLVFMSLVLTATSTVNELSEALNWYLSFLRPFKVPVDDLITTISIAIRFIPLTFAEFNRVVYAQKSRGLDFESGSIIRRIKAYLPVFIPMFVGLFKRSYDLADAMDSRCYRGEGRTVLRQRKLGMLEICLAVLALFSILVLAIVY